MFSASRQPLLVRRPGIQAQYEGTVVAKGSGSVVVGWVREAVAPFRLPPALARPTMSAGTSSVSAFTSLS